MRCAHRKPDRQLKIERADLPDAADRFRGVYSWEDSWAWARHQDGGRGRTPRNSEMNEPTMKKVFTLALLAVATVGFAHGRASAGHLFHHCNTCVTFCLTSYNAFSPPCLGVKNCHGCCVPFPGCPTQEPAADCGLDGSCGPDGSCGGQLPAATTGDKEAKPAPGFQ